MEGIGLTILITTLDDNGLNTSIKSQKLSELIKKRDQTMFFVLFFFWFYKKHTLNEKVHLKVSG